MNPLPQMPHQPQMPQAEKSQAGTNLAIVILVLVIVVVGVKLLMFGTPAQAPSGGLEATSTTTSTATSSPAEPVSTGSPTQQEQSASVVKAFMPEGAGEAVFSVSSAKAIVVREIFVHNPYRVGDADKEWLQVYDGYKSIPAGQTVTVFTVSLASLTYDRVRVRTLSAITGAADEIVKDMAVTVVAKTTTPITIEL